MAEFRRLAHPVLAMDEEERRRSLPEELHAPAWLRTWGGHRVNAATLDEAHAAADALGVELAPDASLAEATRRLHEAEDGHWVGGGFVNPLAPLQHAGRALRPAWLTAATDGEDWDIQAGAVDKDTRMECIGELAHLRRDYGPRWRDTRDGRALVRRCGGTLGVLRTVGSGMNATTTGINVFLRFVLVFFAWKGGTMLYDKAAELYEGGPDASAKLWETISKAFRCIVDKGGKAAAGALGADGTYEQLHRCVTDMLTGADEKVLDHLYSDVAHFPGSKSILCALLASLIEQRPAGWDTMVEGLLDTFDSGMLSGYLTRPRAHGRDQPDYTATMLSGVARVLGCDTGMNMAGLAAEYRKQEFYAHDDDRVYHGPDIDAYQGPDPEPGREYVEDDEDRFYHGPDPEPDDAYGAEDPDAADYDPANGCPPGIAEC